MGNEQSRPDNLTFNFEVDDGIITVNATKSSQIIQETDFVVFNLTEKDQIMRRYFQNDYWAPYLWSTDPSDYDLDWSNISRILYPVYAKIVNQSDKLVTVQSTELKNPSAEKGEFTWTVNKSKFMKETYKRKWFAETNVTSKIDIAYKILSLGAVKFSRKTTENVECEHIQTAKSSTQTEIRVNLEPNRSVRVELQVVVHTIDIEVGYEASLCGEMVVGFNNKLKGVRAIQRKSISQLPGVPATAIYKEIITLEYYTDGDRVTMTTINSLPHKIL